MSLSDELKENIDRYLAAMRALQSGVALDLELRNKISATPKNLRTGLDMRAVDHAALVLLLVRKGVITYEEYSCAIADEAEREVGRYERRISEILQRPVSIKRDVHNEDEGNYEN